MSKKVLFLTAIVLVFTALNLQGAQIPVSWDGGGNYNDWDNANNWEPNIVPNNGTDTYVVTINAGTGEVGVGLRQRSTIDQLDCYGEVGLVMGPHDWQNEPIKLILVNPSGLTNHGYLEIEELEISGNVTNTAGAELYLKDLYITGNLHNLAGGIIEFDDAYVMGENSSGVVENAGFIITFGELEAFNTFHNTGQINIYDGECGSDSLFHNDVNGVIKGFGILYAGQLQNKGQITAFGGSLTFLSEGSVTNTGTLANKALSTLHIQPAEDVNNFGTIEVNAGGVAFNCNLVNEPNGIIKLLGGTLAATSITQTADANFVGFGGITGDVVIAPNGIIKLAGPTNIVGDVEIDEHGTLEISDGSTLITGSTTNNGVIHVVNGNVVFQGGYSGNGVVNK